MNTKSFSIGFVAMDSIIGGVSATKRGIVSAAKATAHGAQVSAQATKNGALATSDVVTSFFAGASQAVKCRTGKCRMLAVDTPRLTVEVPLLTSDVRSNEE